MPSSFFLNVFYAEEIFRKCLFRFRLGKGIACVNVCLKRRLNLFFKNSELDNFKVTKLFCFFAKIKSCSRWAWWCWKRWHCFDFKGDFPPQKKNNFLASLRSTFLKVLKTKFTIFACQFQNKYIYLP